MGGLSVIDAGRLIEFTYDDLVRYHGPGSPAGVAHAFKVLELTLPLLAGGEPPERRDIHIRTAFGGPGARDGFELVTRAVTGGRYTVDETLAIPARGYAAERFVFELRHRHTTVTVAVNDGFVTDEFIDLARTPDRTPAQEQHFAELKRRSAEHVMGTPAADVYNVLG
ncbi:MAG: hypothetical protein QOF76_3302 [Solirubrobacteraceae bacterium]|nr:hypothetical protein [Solirubrobacteraceae bacterium]